MLILLPMDSQEIQDPKKVSKVWVTYLNKIVKSTNNTQSSMIDMSPKDAIKQDTVPLEKTYPE